MGGLSVGTQSMFQTLVESFSERNMSTLEIFQLNSANTVFLFMVITSIFETNNLREYQLLTGK